MIEEMNDPGTGVADMNVDTSIVTPEEAGQPEDVRKLVKKIQETVRVDLKHHDEAFKKMRRDMYVAKYGAVPPEPTQRGAEGYPKTSYRANLCGRHIKQKTAALYAKNPKIVARRRETVDFQVWDENPDSLKLAFQTVQQGQQLLAQAQTAPQMDPATGQPMPAGADVPEAMIQAFQQATATIQDFQAGMQRREQLTKFGKTLEILMAQALREQKPVDFKTGMKQLVRRACTTGVGYIELGFQRETGPRPGMTEKLADIRARLDHLQELAEGLADGEYDDTAPERAELEFSLNALMAEPDAVLREGLIVDYPTSTRVIPDRLCTQLEGFIGARHLTVEYLFTPQEIEEMFGVDLDDKFVPYSVDGQDDTSANPSLRVIEPQEENGIKSAPVEGKGLVRVWKHYDKPSGLVYYVADGYDAFLREPAAPDVFVEDFWPVYALTFNAVESESELFPPSDVALMLDMQMEYNRSRQGMREHRKAARPRWAYQNGALETNDINNLKTLEPFEAVGINFPQGSKLVDILQGFPVPGVDPNLYETNQLFTDIQLTVGSSEALMGGVAKATATESAIAANSSASSDQSSIDDLDAFLTRFARSAGQILLKEMSAEQVMAIAGPGAVWADLPLEEIAKEMFLDVEAGSTGRPNQAVEIDNWSKMLPFLVQMPGINPFWLARETVRRLDDKVDLNEAIAQGIPSVVMQNSMAQAGTGNPATEPTAQAAAGANNGPAPPPETAGGSKPAFGSNQV